MRKIRPVIILTLTPRLSALRIVSALSCLGGSKSGMRPMNCHGPPGLSFLPSRTSCTRIDIKHNQNTQTLTYVHRDISDLQYRKGYHVSQDVSLYWY